MKPLAERLRPEKLQDIVGQHAVLGEGSSLRRLLAAGQLPSLLLWGPPGVGKTTLARVLAADTGREMAFLSAVQSGVKELRAAVDSLPESPAGVLFMDEVHRFNKAQQDALLPWVESGRIVFFGATTENPSFSINRALLSRLQVVVLNRLEPDELKMMVRRALAEPEGFNGQIRVDDEALNRLVELADGDGRRALGMLEQAALLADGGCIDAASLKRALQAQPRAFDKGGDEFYQQISALHKSIRGSDPDAALYWLARMLDGGCDPRYIARRLIRMASEDIGNADPRLLGLCVDAAATWERLGSPEGDLALAQATTYLACAPKSNAVYMAWNAACEDARSNGSLPVPEKLRNASSSLMRELGHGQGYRYAHDEAQGVAWGEHYMPEALIGRRYYTPGPNGLEKSIAEKLAMIRKAQDESRRRSK